jgi:hypothetical protein
MRRVYYSFAVGFVTSRAFLHLILFTIGLYGIKVMVHVASVVQNLKSVELNYVDNFIYNALTHTDFYTLVFIGVVVFSLLSFNFNVLKLPKMQKMQTV